MIVSFRVRQILQVEYGNSPLGPDDGGSVEVSVMDNFIYGEPQAAE